MLSKMPRTKQSELAKRLAKECAAVEPEHRALCIMSVQTHVPAEQEPAGTVDAATDGEDDITPAPVPSAAEGDAESVSAQEDNVEEEGSEGEQVEEGVEEEYVHYGVPLYDSDSSSAGMDDGLEVLVAQYGAGEGEGQACEPDEEQEVAEEGNGEVEDVAQGDVQNGDDGREEDAGGEAECVDVLEGLRKKRISSRDVLTWTRAAQGTTSHSLRTSRRIRRSWFSRRVTKR